MARVYILIAISLLSGMPPDTSAFKYGELASYDASVFIIPCRAFVFWLKIDRIQFLSFARYTGFM